MMRIVVFIDYHGYPVRRISNLSNCIYNQSIVLFAVVRGNNIQTVADFEKCGKIVFIGGFTPLRNILPAKLIGKGFKLLSAIAVKC